MQLKDITSRVRFMHDDADGTYVTDDMVAGHAQQQYELLQNAIEASTNSQFDEQVIELAAVPAGTPNLDAYMAKGQPLENIITPRILEWKMPGIDPTNYRESAGPLDSVRDVAAGLPSLDSWAWIRRSIKLSKFAIPLDIRLTCTTLFDPLLSPDDIIELERKAVPVLAIQIALAIGKARGMTTLVTTYAQDLDNAFDDLVIALVKADQPKDRRVARICRAPVPRTPWPATTASNPSTNPMITPFFYVTYADYGLSSAIPYAVIEGYGGGAGITVTLGDVLLAKGQEVTLQKMDGTNLGKVRLSAGAAQIAGYGSFYDLVNQNQFITVISDGTQWIVKASN